MIAAERVFVLHVKAGTYYFLPNIDRAILARHLNQMVKVDGMMSAQFNSIKASELFVMEDGKWKKVYVAETSDKAYNTEIYTQAAADLIKQAEPAIVPEIDDKSGRPGDRVGHLTLAFRIEGGQSQVLCKLRLADASGAQDEDLFAPDVGG